MAHALRRRYGHSGGGVIEEIVANRLYRCGGYEAAYFTKGEGARFRGWIVRSMTDRFDVSDPISTKRAALRLLVELAGKRLP